MSDNFTIEADGKPVTLTFGRATGPHVIATLRPVGEMSFREFTDHDYDTDTEKSFPFTARELTEVNWKEHPEECAGMFELRDGEKSIATYAFPSLNDNLSSAAQQEMGENWDKVHAFAKSHGIEMLHIEQEFIDQSLENHLGREAESRSKLYRHRAAPTPSVAPVAPALSA